MVKVNNGKLFQEFEQNRTEFYLTYFNTTNRERAKQKQKQIKNLELTGLINPPLPKLF